MNEHKTPATKDEAISKFSAWIRQRPGLEFGNYGDISAYRSELRTIAKQKHRAEAALSEFATHDYRPEVLADTMKSAYSGRLEFDAKGNLDYCAGQYWPTEYRIAAAVVLESYNATMRRIWAEENNYTPPPFHSIADVKAANRAIGAHWFDASTMRYFRCKIESKLIARASSGRMFFITSEQFDDGSPRLYTVREAKADGSVDTYGKFQEHKTWQDARNAITGIA